MGEQHLCGEKAVLVERAFVGLHQAHLPDGRRRLQFMHGIGTLFPAQTLHAFGDGAGGDEHHFATARAQGGDLLRPVGDGLNVQAGATVGNEAAADFDDDAFGLS